MSGSKDQTGDLLLWLAAAVVVLMGLAWLLVEAPWSSPEPAAIEVAAAAPSSGIEAEPAPEAATVASASPVKDPLQMAQMALDAGMLTEPADYSAWTLFGRIADREPGNAGAREGLERVTAALLQRGATALEQGRYDDAGAIAATITGRFPEHEGALALAAEIEIATRPPEPAAPEPEPKVAVKAPAPVDPIPAMNDAFHSALARNDVLRPAGTSAVDIVKEMIATAPDHELTAAARDLLVTEMLDRSAQSIEALDTRAAQTWIDSAAPLAAEPDLIARAQERLNRYLIDAETQRMVPASDLEAIEMEPAEYPRVPLQLGVEGWIDIEFVVNERGETRDVTVVKASNDRYFRDAAVAAVEQWRFEPFVFMGRPIPKRAYTRLEFVLN